MRVEAATTCGTDVKMWRRGHPVLGAYPARFGHETAGVRDDTGERVLVGDSVACGALRAVPRRPAADLPRPALGARRLRRALAAPEAALHAIPDGLDAAGAAMAEPLGAAVHAIGRAPPRALAPDAGVLGGGPMGQMLASLLVAEGARSRSPTRTPSAAPRRRRSGAMTPPSGSADHDARLRGGRPARTPGAPRSRPARPAACVVLVGGCPGGTHVAAPDPSAPLRRARPPRRLPPLAATRSTARWRCSPSGAVDWRALAAGPIGLDDLPTALAERGGPARKWVVDPAPSAAIAAPSSTTATTKTRRASGGDGGQRNRGGAEEDHLEADPDRLGDLDRSPSAR